MSDEFGSAAQSNGRDAAAVLERVAEPPTLLTQRMPVRWQWVELTDEWAGWKAEMHMNPPIGLILAMEGNTLGIFEELPKLIRAWNFGDPEGRPVPISADGLRSLPDTLLKQLATAYSDARGLPKATSAT